MQTSNAVDLLNRVLDELVNSIVQYTTICAPYVPDGFDEQAEAIARIDAEEKQLAAEIVGLIQSRDGVPGVGVFKYWNVDLNYLDIRFMAKFAVQHESPLIEDIEAELGSVADDPEVHGLIRRTLDRKREHLARLAEIAGDY